MGLRMKRSFTICKNTKLDLGPKGVGINFGENGLRYTLNSCGIKTSKIGVDLKKTTCLKIKEGEKEDFPEDNEGIDKEEIEELDKNLTAEEYNSLLKSLVSVHKSCEESIDWKKINSLDPPYNFSETGPNEQKAAENYEKYAPAFLEKIFKSLGENKKNKLFNMIAEGKRIDKEIYLGWENLNVFSNKVLEEDIDAYFQVIDEMSPFDELLNYGSDFEFGANDGNAVEVEFRVKSSKVIPVNGPCKNGKPCGQAMSKTKYYDLVQDYACSAAIRIARDVMAIIPVEKVVVHAVDTIIDNETKEFLDITILSVVFDRETLNTLKFDSLDPSDALRNFLCNMKQQKTTGLEPVSRILYY